MPTRARTIVVAALLALGLVLATGACGDEGNPNSDTDQNLRQPGTPGADDLEEGDSDGGAGSGDGEDGGGTDDGGNGGADQPPAPEGQPTDSADPGGAGTDGPESGGSGGSGAGSGSGGDSGSGSGSGGSGSGSGSGGSGTGG